MKLLILTMYSRYNLLLLMRNVLNIPPMAKLGYYVSFKADFITASFIKVNLT